MSASIFISFASKDVKVATTLCSALESRGFACWISARDILPGENFQVSIVRALRHAKIMLLVFTANSNTSEEMTKELALASQQKLIVIPLRIEDVAPNDAFAYEFATRQWIDVFADWETSIDQLCRRIGRALEGLPDGGPHEKPQPAPLVTEPSAAALTSPAPGAARRRETAAEIEPEPAAHEPVPETKAAPAIVAPPPLAAAAFAPPDTDYAVVGPLTAPVSRKGLVRAGLLAAAIGAVTVLGLTAPKLLAPKLQAAPQVAAASPLAPVQATGSAQLAPVALAAQATLAPEAQAAPKPRRKAEAQAAKPAAKTDLSDVDIPF